MTRFPVCCGMEMMKNIETSTFIEIGCRKCGDVIYMKKDIPLRPELLDD